MKFFSFISLYFTSILCFAQVDFDQLNQLYKNEPKPILIYFYTDWCRICKIQEKQIEQNLSLKESLNNDVYFIKFDAESDRDVSFLNQNFKANSSKNKKTNHSLLNAFIQQQEINYPLWIFLNQDLELIDKYPGLIQPKNLEKIINQLKKDANK